MGFKIVGLGQRLRGTEWPYFHEQIPLTISEDPCLHRHFLSFLCNSPLLPRLPKGRGIAGIFLSTKPAYMLCTAGKFFWFKTPADSPAPSKVFSLLTPRLYLAGNQKPRTTTALDTTRTTQLPDTITVLKPHSPRHFPGPRVAGVTNDWCITCFKPDFTSFK